MIQDVVVLTLEDIEALRETAEEIADLACRTLDACTEFAATLGRTVSGGDGDEA